MEQQLIELGVATFKMAMMLALPALLSGMFIGLGVSIFQAATQINEQTLSFIPKVVSVAVVIILTMPWMLNSIIDFTTELFNMIPQFVQ